MSIITRSKTGVTLPLYKIPLYMTELQNFSGDCQFNEVKIKLNLLN